MRKMEKERICEKMQKEISAIMDESKLTPNGLENASKMVDIVKDIKNMEYWDVKCDYYKAVLESMRSGGHSQKMDGEYSRESDGENYFRDDYDNGNSYRRGRNQNNGQYMHRPNHSRMAGDDTGIDKYREHKMEYSTNRDAGSKEKMLDSLEDLMSKFHDMMKQMFKDADCREERDIIQTWARKIADM